jgi:hypothetical protein
MEKKWLPWKVLILLLGGGVGFGFALGRAGSPREAKPASRGAGDRLAPETRAAVASDWQRAYPQYQPVGTELKPFPIAHPGDIVPQELYRFWRSRAVLLRAGRRDRRLRFIFTAA